MNRLRTNNGSTTIFLLLISTTIIVIFITLIGQIQKRMEVNEVIRDSEVVSKALLSSYDGNIYKNYGLLAYNFKRIDKYKYVKGNFRYDLDVTITKEKELTDFSEVQKQMAQISKIMIGFDVIEDLYKELDKMNKKNVKYDTKSGDGLDLTEEKTKKKNTSILNIDTHFKDMITGQYKTISITDRENLPSNTIYDSFYKSTDLIQEMAVNEYILGTFKSRVKTDKRTYDFFSKERESYLLKGELEYVLYGNYSEAANMELTYITIAGIRATSNSAHILACKSKMKKINIFSKAAMLLEIPEPLTQAAVVGTWSFIESHEDMKKIIKGEEVAFYKISDKSWETNIFSDDKMHVSEEKEDKEPREIYLNYNDYLRALLLLTNEDNKMRRVMDIIYLDYKYLYGEEIKMWDYTISHDINVSSYDTDFTYKLSQWYH